METESLILLLRDNCLTETRITEKYGSRSGHQQLGRTQTILSLLEVHSQIQ